MAGVSHFHTKVVGVSRANDDGSSRQAIVAACRPLEPLELVPEPDNPADPNAVKVCTSAGEQLGYLSRELAAEVVGRSARGWRYLVLLKQHTGGGRKTRGANLLILCGPPGTTDSDAQAYLNELVDDDPEIRHQLPSAFAAGTAHARGSSASVESESEFSDWAGEFRSRPTPLGRRTHDDGELILRAVIVAIVAIVAAIFYVLFRIARH